MVIRLDIWHFMHRFDAAVQNEAHPKYGAFKKALSGAIFEMDQGDLNLLIESERAAAVDHWENLSDTEVAMKYQYITL